MLTKKISACSNSKDGSECMRNLRKETIDYGCIDTLYEPKPKECYNLYRITWTIFKVGKFSFAISWQEKEILKHIGLTKQ